MTNLQTIIAIFAVVSVGTVGMTQAWGADTTQSVTVNGVCSFSTSPTVNFGLVNANAESGEQTITVTNNGSSELTTIGISGSDWTRTAPSLATFGVGSTHYGLVSDTYAAKTTLTNIDSNTGITSILGTPTPIFVEMKADIPAFKTGDYTQTVTISGLCA